MNKIISINKPKSPISEAYRGIRTSIQFSNLDKKIKVINVTSSKQGEGKTTIIANLAATFSNLEKKVLILDGDLRNPGVHRTFGLSNIHGLTDILIGNKGFADCIHCTDIKNLHILTCGPIPPNPSEILSSQIMVDFIEELKKEYDYIFIDSPPIGIVTDAGITSTYTDGCIFVVGSNEVDVEIFKISKERLDSVGANILGIILNKYEVGKNSNNYYNSYYMETRRNKKIKNKNKKNKVDNREKANA